MLKNKFLTVFIVIFVALNIFQGYYAKPWGIHTQLLTAQKLQKNYFGQRVDGYKLKDKNSLQGSQGLYFDQAYYVRGCLGTPSQDSMFYLDTGSPSSWVASTRCDSSCANATTKYNQTASSTAKSTGLFTNVTYGDGSQVEGYAVNETFSINNITVQNAKILAATKLIDQQGLDGLLGMSPPSSDPTQLTTFWTSALDQYTHLQQKVFAVWLNTNFSGPEQGELTLGGVNSDRYKGDIKYHNMASSGTALSGLWALKYQKVSVDAEGFLPTNCTEDDCIIVIDTGTTDFLTLGVVGLDTFVQSNFTTVSSTVENGCKKTVGRMESYMNAMHTDAICQDPYNWFKHMCGSQKLNGAPVCPPTKHRKQFYSPHNFGSGFRSLKDLKAKSHHHQRSIGCDICKQLSQNFSQTVAPYCDPNQPMYSMTEFGKVSSNIQSTCTNIASGYQQYNIFNCDQVDKGRTITITIEGTDYTIGPRDYSQQIGDGLCIARVISQSEGTNTIIAGIPFLRSYYTIFDQINKKIGLAKSI